MKDILIKLINTETLSKDEAKAAMMRITAGTCNDAQIAAFLTVYQMRSPTVDEFIGFREGLLETRVPIDFAPYSPIDIVGTGGDGKNTFNISTCACFVVAGAGYKVAKHGNFGATSVSGASNVMQQHGVVFTNDESRLRRSLEECNMVYMHAPLFNPAMRFAAPVRKNLQIKTIFNLLGPMVNPSKPRHQLLGVADLSQMRLYSNVFQTLDMGFAVVTSLDGYDEVSLTGKFKVIASGYEMVLSPHDLGMPTVKMDEIYGGNTAEEACAIFDSVLENRSTRAQRDVVIVNAAYAIQVLSPEKTIMECIDIARESLESGSALAVLKKFISLNS